jgi:hypothetical protein
MRITNASLSFLFLLYGSSRTPLSTLAFSPPLVVKKHSVTSIASGSFFPTSLRVASSETISVANMQRGIGGRLEDAFENAKMRGEAAFVTFVTAGYPSSQGEFILNSNFFKPNVPNSTNITSLWEKQYLKQSMYCY